MKQHSEIVGIIKPRSSNINICAPVGIPQAKEKGNSNTHSSGLRTIENTQRVGFYKPNTIIAPPTKPAPKTPIVTNDLSPLLAAPLPLPAPVPLPLVVAGVSLGPMTVRVGELPVAEVMGVRGAVGVEPEVEKKTIPVSVSVLGGIDTPEAPEAPVAVATPPVNPEMVREDKGIPTCEHASSY